MTTARSSRRSSSSSSARTPSSSDAQASTKKPRSKSKARNAHAGAQRSKSIAAVAERIAAVKRLLVAEAPTGDVLDEFMDSFMNEPSFLFDFQVSRHQWLRDAIARSCEEMLGQPTGGGTVNLMEIPEHRLVHGSLWFDGYMGIAVYFDDIRLGAMGLFPNDHPEMALLARLVCLPCSSDPRMMLN